MRSLNKACLTMACLLAAAQPLLAEPYVPAGDDTVVETVRAGTTRPAGAGTGAARPEPANATPELRRLKQLQAQWRQATGPGKERLALAYARAAIERARQEGDPRWLGAAQAALGEWWARPDPPAPARLLRATILQSLHDFNASLKDLDALLDARHTPEPIRTQARFTRAGVLQVQGRWRDAAQDCKALDTTAPLESAACLAELRSLTGDTALAQTTLNQLMQHGTPSQQSWLLLMRAELAERMGQAAQADMLYRQALLASPDSYTRGAYADFLLDQGRAHEVEDLLQSHQQVDALLLRLAMAWQRMGPGRATQLQTALNTLQANFDAARVRAERVHMREEARFELVLKGRPQAALALAQANWAVQKEPADARVLMDAALAARQADAMQALAAWVGQQGLLDARLSALAKPASPKPGRLAS